MGMGNIGNRGGAELLRVSLLSSVGFIAFLWVCSVSAQVAIETSVQKQQVVVPVSYAAPAAANDTLAINRPLPNRVVEPSNVWLDATSGSPGDKLRYTLKVRNVGQYAVPKGHLHVQDKVPQGTLLTPETLQQENRLNAFSVSADGVSFVAGSAAVGPTDGWRWLRWEYLAPLEPGQDFNLSYETILQAQVDPQDDKPTPPIVDF